MQTVIENFATRDLVNIPTLHDFNLQRKLKFHFTMLKLSVSGHCLAVGHTATDK